MITAKPATVRGALINNFAGVRIDGTNATIVGSMPGEFMADRNNITRVWMDHGAWPLLTLKLYMEQTGDIGILLSQQSYFRDRQFSRSFRKDDAWSESRGRKLKDKAGRVYEGTLLEHILIQHLVQFFNVGEHNITRLESADWNDGLDMAFERGESVAFMSFYGGNLFLLADLLDVLARKKKLKKVALAREVLILLDSLSGKKVNYERPAAKRELLFDRYFKAVEPFISGKKVQVSIDELTNDLRLKAAWIFQNIRKKEKITIGDRSWFNGYYDNKGRRVEGKRDGRVRMTLTGQVFAIMSGMATEEDIRQIVRAVNVYLKNKDLGGIRLNTDFGLRHYLDLGRAFGFAYGTKENGSFFSHMTVMYAYALYKRGFAREGYNVLQSIYRMCRDGEKARIYSGVPEYFDPEGRGMYPYLTGSASWLVMTKLTQAFGIRGQYGDLALFPKLVKEEFDKAGRARADCSFAGKKISVIYINPQGLDAGRYNIKEIFLNKKKIQFFLSEEGAVIDRKRILQTAGTCRLHVLFA
jgi:cellobiose phosphorylase